MIDDDFYYAYMGKSSLSSSAVKMLADSPTPLLLAFALAKSTSPIGFAAEVIAPAIRESFFGAAISSTVPQAWHSPHLPTHFVALQPHLTQRKGSFAGAFAMALI